MFGSQKMLGKKNILWKIILFSLDDMENTIEKIYKGKFQ